MSLAEIERQLHLPKPTLLRLLQVLVSTGFLERPSRNNYRPALKMWRLGCKAVDYDDVRLQVLPLLQELVSETGESAHFSVYETGYSVYVEKVDGNHPVRAYTSVGSRSPAFASATGKALLAWQGPTEIEQVTANAEQFTEATISSAAQFEEAAREIRARGWSVNRGEWRADVWGVAAPVFGRTGEVVSALGISGPRERLEPKVEEYGELVRGAARRQSTYLGHNGDPTRRHSASEGARSGQAR